MFNSDIESAKDLIHRCVDGQCEARRTFMDRYGVMIYNYPAALARSSKQDPGDFFLYAFEKDRIFRRLRHFRGERISLEDYLRFFVLKDLCFEWHRQMSKRCHQLGPYDDDVILTGENLAKQGFNQDTPEGGVDQVSAVQQLLRREEFLILKLLYLQGFDLGNADIRNLAAISGRSIGETMSLVVEVQESLAERSSENQEIEDKLTAIHMTMIGYEERIGVLRNELKQLDPRYHSREITACSEEIAELERKWQWRVNQRQALSKRLWDRVQTTPYNDLARLLNRPLGSICSAVARARKAFRKAYEEMTASSQGQEVQRQSVHKIKREGPDDELPR